MIENDLKGSSSHYFIAFVKEERLERESGERSWLDLCGGIFGFFNRTIVKRSSIGLPFAAAFCII